MNVELNKETVERIARLHDERYDRRSGVFPEEYLDQSHLTEQELAAAGYHYPARSHLTVCELQRILNWKWPAGKTKRYAERNGLKKVESVTRGAFQWVYPAGAHTVADPIKAIGALCELDGVGVRMASAILTALDPLRFTVLDVRACRALKELGLLDALGLSPFEGRLDDAETYGPYLRACVLLADTASVSLRSLDRCLWTLDACRSIMNERGLYDWARAGLVLAPIVQLGGPKH